MNVNFLLFKTTDASVTSHIYFNYSLIDNILFNTVKPDSRSY